MTLRVMPHQRINTQNNDKEVNGFLVPIFNVHDGWVAPAQCPQQVYLTVVSPRKIKGPHLHFKRWGLFTCIRGNVKIVVRVKEKYEEYLTGEDYQFATIQIPAGMPAAIQNVSNVDAYVLNMPSPAWCHEDQDEHVVSFDDYVFTY